MSTGRFGWVELLATVVFLICAIPDGIAQYAWFARSSDSIAVAGQTVVSNQCSIECVVMLPSSRHSGGSVFDEWVLDQEEKSLSLSYQGFAAVAYPNDYLEITEKAGLISLDKWHHVAFVCDGTEARFYLDGELIQSGPAPQLIFNATGEAFIGSAPRGDSQLPSFVGYLDSLRVSKVARYSGLAFVPTIGDLASDQDTLLLYNFNDMPGSATVKDESTLGRTGTLGVGFAGATAPRLISVLPTEVPLDLEIFTAVELQFLSSLNGRYQIQSSPDMAVWSDLPGLIAGNGTVITNLISTRQSGRLFYRIVSRP